MNKNGNGNVPDLKRYLTIIVCVLAVAFIAIVILLHLKEDSTGEIIGGADEPTTIILKNGVEGDNKVADYTSITMDEAKNIFETAGDYIILDVRRSDEFADGHIPGAINVANEDIIADMPKELPNLDQTIYVYCRSGRRSKEAATKLAAIGYTGIIECGGIIDWTGEIEK